MTMPAHRRPREGPAQFRYPQPIVPHSGPHQSGTSGMPAVETILVLDRLRVKRERRKAGIRMFRKNAALNAPAPTAGARVGAGAGAGIGVVSRRLSAVGVCATAILVLAACQNQPVVVGAAPTESPLVTPSASAGLVVLPSMPAPTSTAGATAPPTGTPTAGGDGSAAGGSGNSVQTGGAGAGTPECATSSLSSSATVVPTSAGAGNMLLNVTLTNTSNVSCAIVGYPELQLLDKNRIPQATTTTWDPAVAKTVVTLAPQGTASTTVRFDFDIPAAGEPSTGACEPSSLYLSLTPPNNGAKLLTQIGGNAGAGITACNHGALDVLPFVPGPTGPNQ